MFRRNVVYDSATAGASDSYVNASVQNPPQISSDHIYVKGKVHLKTGHEGPERGVDVLLYYFFNLAVRWGELSTPRSDRFTTGEPVPIVEEAGWVPGPVWKCVDRSTRSESLYRIRHPGPPTFVYSKKCIFSPEK